VSLTTCLIPSPRRLPFLAIFIIALVLRLVYLAEVWNTPIWEWHQLQITDTDTFLGVAEQIRGGDVLVHEPYHPYRNHGWAQAFATEEEWQRWLGPHTFYQAPGYYYLLAALLTIFPGSLTAVRVVQLLLGAFHAVLLGLVGQMIFGRTAGLAAGLLAAIYGPFIAAEAMILRDTIGLVFATAALYVVLHAVERARTGESQEGTMSWLVAGIVLGCAAIVKDTGLVLLAGVTAWMLMAAWFGWERVRVSAVVLVLCGALVSFSPLVLRNLAVGAPPFALSANVSANIAIANAIDAPAGGVFFSNPPSLHDILEKSDGRVLATILETFRPYEADPTRLLNKVRAKWSAMWRNVELPDNFSYRYFTRYSSLLAALPRFAFIWLLALLGVGLLVYQRLSQPQSLDSSVPWEGLTGLSLLGTLLAFHVIAQSFAVVMSRYRLVLVPLLMIPAGVALGVGYQWIMARHWRPLAAWACGLAILCVLWWSWPAEARLQMAEVRPVDFAAGAAGLAERGDLMAAWNELEQGIQYCRTHAALSPGEASYAELLLRRDRLLLFVRRGRFTDVQQDWEVLRQSVSENDPAIQEVIRFLDQRESGSH